MSSATDRTNLLQGHLLRLSRELDDMAELAAAAQATMVEQSRALAAIIEAAEPDREDAHELTPAEIADIVARKFAALREFLGRGAS